MFAVVRTGGKQYRIAPGDKIVVEKLDGNAGDRVTLGDVLIAGEGSDLKPTDGLTVAAEIVAQAKGEKVTVFKKRRRHNYRRKKGHRQQHTILKIVAIGDQKAEKPAKTASIKATEPKATPAADAATPSPNAGEPTAAAPAKPTRGKKPASSSADAAAEASKPAQVEAPDTPNPAPEDEFKANPPRKSDVEAAPKAAKGKKAAADKPTAETVSTENVAPAKPASSSAEKGAPKKAPKGK